MFLNMLNTNKRRGMTLMELMAVILIIGIVFGYGVVSIGQNTEKAKYSAAWLDITSLTSAVIISSAEIGDNEAFFAGMADPALYAAFTKRLDKSYADMRDPWGAAYTITADSTNQKITIECASKESDLNGMELKRVISFKEY